MSAAEASLRKFSGKPLKDTTQRSQSQSASADNTSSVLPLTFGIELEFVLAIHDELYAPPEFAWLYAPLKSPSGTVVLEKRQSRALGSRGNKRKQLDLINEIVEEKQHPIHPELAWTSRILESHGLDHDVASETHTDVRRWGVVPDITVNAAGWDELLKYLPDRVRRSTLKQWDAQGVEMVSRVLKAPNQTQKRVLQFDPALKEIGRYLTALRGSHNTPWGVYVNSSCGLHVHVGLEPNLSDAGILPLDVLQHLNYMLVQFETSISGLHPRGRRALADTMLGTGRMLGSNLMGLRQARHVCDKAPLPLLDQIQDRIFGEDMTVEGLAKLMSETMRGVPTLTGSGAYRFKFVNFARLVGPKKENGARTIEFRQHGGSLQAEEIGRWVIFVTGLVRAAERLAARPKPVSPDSPSPMSRLCALQIHMELPFARKQGNKYKLKCQKQSDEYERLFDLMEMPRLDREYWMGRYILYNPEEACGKDELLSISTDDCPICATETYRSPMRSPVLYRVTEEYSSSDSSMSQEEVDRLRMVWGIRDSVHIQGESGDEGIENETPPRPGSEGITKSKFFSMRAARLEERQEALRLADRQDRSSFSGKRRRTGQSGSNSKRRSL